MPPPLSFESKILSNSSCEAHMPTYEYFCLTCNKTFSQVLTLAEFDKQKVVCPECHGTNVEQRPASFYAVTSKKSA
jgi:putative FmdB family regulatory protein